MAICAVTMQGDSLDGGSTEERFFDTLPGVRVDVDFEASRTCSRCDLHEDDIDGDSEVEECLKGEDGALHDFGPPGPGVWANSASVLVDHEEITVLISAGDPRGAFAMTLRRRSPDGSLLLEVPYEGMGWSHLPLTQLSPGVFRVS